MRLRPGAALVDHLVHVAIIRTASDAEALDAGTGEILEAVASDHVVEFGLAQRPEDEQAARVIYFPELGRGAIKTGGDWCWTDADGLADVVTRWEAEGRVLRRSD